MQLPSVQVDTLRKHRLALFWLTATYTGLFNLCPKVDYSGPVVHSGSFWSRFVGWDFSEATEVYRFLGLVQVLLKSAKWFIFHERCMQIHCTVLEGDGHVSPLTAFHHVVLGVYRLSSKGRWGCHVCGCQSSKPAGMAVPTCPLSQPMGSAHDCCRETGEQLQSSHRVFSPLWSMSWCFTTQILS